MSIEWTRALPVDQSRGTWGMSLFIATEATLFLVLFFSYYFLASSNTHWPLGEPPKLKFAAVMTLVLVSSSLVLKYGERKLKQERSGMARAALATTILLGVTFLVLQVFEYRDHLKTLTPRSNAYGSIFYLITTLHGAHVLLGVSMLLFVLILPRLRPAEYPPYHNFRNASLYWHFVDVVWLIIITILYIAPNVRQ